MCPSNNACANEKELANFPGTSTELGFHQFLLIVFNFVVPVVSVSVAPYSIGDSMPRNASGSEITASRQELISKSADGNNGQVTCREIIFGDPQRLVWGTVWRALNDSTQRTRFQSGNLLDDRL